MSHAQRLIQRQDAEQCRWHKPMSDALLANQLYQLLRVVTLVWAGHNQLGAGDQCRENIDQ